MPAIPPDAYDRLKRDLFAPPAKAAPPRRRWKWLLLSAPVVLLLPWLLTGRSRAIGRLRERTDASLAAALERRRAGKLDAAGPFARETEAACRAASGRMPGLAEPHWRLGRMCRILMDDARAIEEQDLALAREPGFAPALCERILLSAGQVRRRVEDGGDAIASRERVKGDFAALPAGPEREIAEGFAAWVSGNDARSLLSAALRRDPDLEEARHALATIALEGHRHEESVRLFTEGIRRDRGYVPHLEGRALANLAWGIEAANRGEDPDPRFDEAEKDCTEAQALARRGLVRFMRGFHGAERGRDPREDYRGAVQDFTAAIRADPGRGKAWMWRGVTRASEGRRLLLAGADGTEAFKSAFEDLDEAVRLIPQAADARMWRGAVRASWAAYRAVLKEDVEPLWTQAFADLDEAVRRNPAEGDAWMWRGTAHLLRAGREPARLAEALRDLDEAARLGPEKTDVWVRRGNAREARGDAAGALEDYGRAVRLNPSLGRALEERLRRLRKSP